MDNLWKEYGIGKIHHQVIYIHVHIYERVFVFFFSYDTQYAFTLSLSLSGVLEKTHPFDFCVSVQLCDISLVLKVFARP